MEAAVLPSRAAYLIAGGSAAGFPAAVTRASSRWGGMTEPVVEAHVSGLSQLHELTVRIAKVEALVNIDADLLAAEEIAEAWGCPSCRLRTCGSAAWCSPVPRPRSGSSRIRRTRPSQQARPARCGSRLRKAGPS